MTSRVPRITVLVADPQKLVAQALSIALASTRPDLRVLPELPTTGQEVIKAAGSSRPQVVVLEYWMPDMEGSAIVRLIGDRSPETKVILLSWLYSSNEILAALRAGGIGFVPKSVDLDVLGDAISQAHAGETPVHAVQLIDLVEKLDERYKVAEEIAGRLKNLTNRELQILSLLSEGMTADQIAQKLVLSVKTIKSHVYHILKKTRAQNAPAAVAMARQAGVLRT